MCNTILNWCAIPVLCLMVISCNNAQLSPTSTKQVFTQGNYTIHNTYKDNGTCEIAVFANQKLVFQKNIGHSPAQIKTMNGDTLYVERLIKVKSLKGRYARKDFIDTEKKLILAVADHFYEETPNEAVSKVSLK